MIFEDRMLIFEHNILAISKLILENLMWNFQRILPPLQQCKITLSNLILGGPLSSYYKEITTAVLTRKRADTVWKEEPFFFPPFLPPASANRRKEKKVLKYGYCILETTEHKSTLNV